MPLALANQRILNPVSSISYRLMGGAESWRITRSAPIGNVVALVHLKGIDGAGVITDDLIVRFIAGYGVEATNAAPSGAAFRSIVLADFITTAEHLVVAAVRARKAYNDGLPGFRPRSPAIGKRFDTACRSLTDAWQSLAVAWSDNFGKEDLSGLPDWMMVAWAGKVVSLDRAYALEAMRGQ